jgi:hypothetical protein
MKTFYFTFGSGHHDDNHQSLGDCYTTIEAAIEYDARRLMFEKRQARWASVYDNKPRFIDDSYRHIPFDELTSQPGPTR